jgi:hypothetical protein
MARDRVLILDADINKRAATELRRRGRNVTSVYTLEIADSLDPRLLEILTENYADAWLLATGDDRMPYRHAAEVQEAVGQPASR